MLIQLLLWDNFDVDLYGRRRKCPFLFVVKADFRIELVTLTGVNLITAFRRELRSYLVQK